MPKFGAERLLDDCMSLLTSMATADDDKPCGQYCPFCKGEIHWPAISRGGGHRPGCRYMLIWKRYDKYKKGT